MQADGGMSGAIASGPRIASRHLASGRRTGSPVATGKVLSVEPTDIPGLCLITLDTQTLHLVDGQKRVLGCIQKHSECSDFSDSVPLLLVDTVELRARKQLFSSINSTAAKVSSSLNAIYDLQSALASFIPETFPVELLEVEKATVAKSSDKLLTPGIAKEAIATIATKIAKKKRRLLVE